MKQKILPGHPLNKTNVFDLTIGDKVYDKSSNQIGIISDIRETGYEVVEAFVKLKTDEIPAWKLPECVYLGQEAV